MHEISHHIFDLTRQNNGSKKVTKFAVLVSSDTSDPLDYKLHGQRRFFPAWEKSGFPNSRSKCHQPAAEVLGKVVEAVVVAGFSLTSAGQ
jgi:hypothetical protein